ncbi:unnamed protein product [Microthlaspi erraticum]|uniref:Arabidopsis retrotransposon Orf1 C-terminal domain-containing protein n=1 Tax=Microthlaspi erraticum TaxID=1685480 RepID=A0A6D2JCY9_9BRAS|nr:unnamed protein product [Microthlaspi erraticum]
MNIKFCKTNLLIDHKEVDEKYQFKFTHPTAGPSKLVLPNPELTTVIRGSKDEPLCCGCSQEDWTSPKVQQVAREGHEKMQKSMDKMVSKIKSLEKKVSGSSSKKKKTPIASTFPGVDPSHHSKETPCPRASQSLSFEPREEGDNTQRRRKSSKPDALTRPLDSIESKQRKLNSVELMVELT